MPIQVAERKVKTYKTSYKHPLGFHPDGFPADEWDLAELAEGNLWSLEAEVRDFEAALALFDYCELQLTSPLSQPQKDRFQDWLFIAAREGAMSAYHAYVAFQGARDNAYKCPSIMNVIDRSAL
jgi:hypothetical protein